MKLRFKPIAKPVDDPKERSRHTVSPVRSRFAQGGRVHQGETLGPRGKAVAMLRDHGVEAPSPTSIDHVSSVIHSHYDPATVALALAQASSAEHGKRSLGRHDKLHLLHHAAAQRGAFADGGAALQPGIPMHPAVAAAYAAMNRPRFDDGGDVPTAALGATPDTDPAPMTGPGPSTPVDRTLAAVPAYAAHVAQGLGDAVTLPRDVMQGSVDPMSPEGLDRANNLAGLAVTGGMPAAEAGALGSGGGRITAYHGSPHSFDKFDLSKIGTGEGAQAYGHGLYFAENEKIAKDYRDTLSGWNVDGKPADSNEPSHIAAVTVSAYKGDTDAAINDLAKTTNSTNPLNERMAAQQAIDLIKSNAKLPNANISGHMYEVGINADPGHFLDWDKPLSEQHPVVQEALSKFGVTKPSMTGGQIYESSRLVPGDYRDPVAAAKALSDAGIPGIKYLDAGSRAAGDGSRNYVSFSDKNIDILRKYGLGGLMAGGAGAAAYGAPGQPAVTGDDGVTRGSFAFGGGIHPAIAAALAAAQRPHFLDGGGAGDGDGEGSSRSGGSSSSGGDNGGDGHGNGGDSSSSSSSGSAGGVGGFGGSSSGDGYGGGSSSGSSGGVGGFGGNSGNDGYGGNSSSSTSNGVGSGYGGSSSGSAGGVGGFGGGSSDGYGGGSSSSGSNSNASSGSSGGVGGFGGGSSDGYGGGSSSGTQSSGGFSSGAASGADSGGVGGSVGGTDSGGGVMGGAGLSGGAGYGSSSGSSGDVGSMGGSYGAPAAGGFSSEGAPSTGGFGNFGATPSAYSGSGMVGASPSASMMSGQTAGQSMSNEASNSGGEAGEDGTNGLGGVSTSGAFNSFGPSTQRGFGSPSPYGGLDSARSTFGATPDGTVGTTPSSVAASNPAALSGLSPSGQMMGVMGTSGMDSGIAGAMGVGTTGTLNGPGAYGFSTDHMAGFDNFGRDGSVTQSSLGAVGYTGRDNAEDQATAATQSNLGAPMAGYVGGPLGLGTSPAVAGAMAAAQPDAAEPGTPSSLTVTAAPPPGISPPGQPMEGLPDYGKPFTPDFSHWNNLVDGVDQTKHPGYVAYGPNGPIGGPQAAAPSDAPAAAASPYGTMSQTPMGPLNVGSLGQAMGTDRTSDTAGLNADGDPTAVNGMSALTIHGTLSPGAQAMSDGVPAGVGVHTQLSPSYAAADGLAANRVYSRTADAQDSGAPPSMIANTAGRDTQSLGMGFNPSSMTDTNFGPATQDVAPGITDSQVAQARQNLSNGTGTAQDRATVQTYLNQQNAPSDGTHPAVAGALAAAGQQAAPSVDGLPAGAFYNSLHTVEGGVLNGQRDPKNPTHYGPAQFSQGTFSDTAAAHPELGIGTGMSMFNATREQYAAITQAHVQDVQSALKDAGYEATPANTYLGWNLGITGAKRALKAGPDATLAEAGISAKVQYANPSIYGYKDTAGWHAFSTMGQVQANLAAKFAGATAPTGAAPATPSSQAPTGLGLGTIGTPGTFSPSGVSYGQSGEDSTPDVPAAPAPAPLTVTRTVTSPTPYGGTAAENGALAGPAGTDDGAGHETPGSMGFDASPANALTVHAFGLQNPHDPASDDNVAANVIGAPSDTPIGQVVSPAFQAKAEQQYPGMFNGVQTVGDLRSNIATIAATAGPPTTSTVTEPGASATPSTLTITPGPRTTTPFSGYTGADGTSPSFGLNTISAGVPTTINNAGTFGVPSGVGVGQDAQNLAGYSQVPSSLPTFARGVVASPGFSPETGFSTSDTSAPNATPSTSDGTMPTTDAPTKHLSVPNWAGNGLAGIAAGSLFGPAGTLLGFGNTLSGLFGGPTAADGINAALAHPGAPTSVTGSPTSASDSNASGREGPYNQSYVPGGYVGDGSGTGNDPQATSTAPAPDGTLPYSAPPLTIRRRHQYYDTTTPSVGFYNPLTDPAVARALAAMRS